MAFYATFLLFLLAIVLSVLRFTDSDYPFDIFKLYFQQYFSYIVAVNMLILKSGSTPFTLYIIFPSSTYFITFIFRMYTMYSREVCDGT